VLAERPELVAPDRVATPARLAYHWVRAHDPARALPAAVEAGLQSEAAYGFADAQGHFELALELWDQVADAGERLHLDHATDLEYAADAADLAGDPNRAIILTRAALAAFGEALIVQGRLRESRELCEEAIAIAGRIGARAEEGDARRALGGGPGLLGDLEAGVEQLRQARRIAEAVGKVDEVARGIATLSGLLETSAEWSRRPRSPCRAPSWAAS
jgi:tetratricopeptide (TPR) repeat protein